MPVNMVLVLSRLVVLSKLTTMIEQVEIAYEYMV